MILQDFVCKITTDFGTISGEFMPDKSCMTFCDGLCKILQDLSVRMWKKDFARFVRQDLVLHEKYISGKIWPDIPVNLQ